MTGARILLIDDDRVRARSLAQACQRAGYSVRMTTAGAIAVEALTRYRPAAVVLDIAAFGGTGTQLHAELLRADPGVRVVLTTALPAGSLLCAALSPLVPVLHQPVSGGALTAALARALSDEAAPALASVLKAYVSALRNLTSTRELSLLGDRLAECGQARAELLAKLTAGTKQGPP